MCILLTLITRPRAKKGAPQCAFSHGNLTCKAKAIVGSRFCSSHGSQNTAIGVKLCEHKDSTGKQCQISVPRNTTKFCPAHRQAEQVAFSSPTPVLQRIQPHMLNPSGYIFNRNLPPTSSQPPATTTVAPSTAPPNLAVSQNPALHTVVTPYNSLYQQQLQQQIHQQQLLYQKQLYMKGQSYPTHSYPSFSQPSTKPPQPMGPQHTLPKLGAQPHYQLSNPKSGS